MNAILKFLFPVKPDNTNVSLFLLAIRLLFGVLLLTHGIQKFNNFEALSGGFPDPLGVGSEVSLVLAILGEVACSLGFIFGALYRLALIPMIFTMCVAFFVIHQNDPFGQKELAFIYLVVFVLMYIIGPGKYALDRFVAIPLSKKK
ncbi:putative oxidoreductase [Parabacteroides sp. PF5-5]|uniref:DoxX family protein n=1 Tax=unclassified Parabacteroides TaxID=2649774 RepID=UPI002475D191|nr:MULTISPECIES: DoxX family protein [unclassified Parabacteroides]MDH6305023.1 putative oxidoreductase [Parabacteroides sp. PH5-39]MDH6315892.1 putative oxidoreductase [Parabacteroides sp. PF5-13]MDH6319549.1 putative oxidoreductase [Parabacteroides sp. PH5-13]MDH6323280.1 putative oxidoreductase [Parabacteroides sp. PH5-8]MDH6327212.1 putative oxidoreductase [Parabacteroides sp. PH5-41]